MSGLVDTLLGELWRIAGFIARAFLHTWPLWAVSIPVAAAVRASRLSGRLAAVFSLRPAVGVVAGAALGALSPLCSCSVIPVVFSLLSSGVPLAPVMAFWLASPSMDPEIFFLSASSLGWPLAAARLAAATLMSLAGGFLTLALDRSGFFSAGVLRDAGVSVPGNGAPSPCACQGAASDGAETAPAEPSDPGFAARFLGALLSSLLFVGKFMALAFAMEALITFYLPEAWIRTALGADSAFAVPLATLVGIPFYATNAQAIGIVGGMLEKGMGAGPALAFLVGGATTTLPAMSAVIGIARARVFAVYLGVAVASALLSGFLAGALL